VTLFFLKKENYEWPSTGKKKAFRALLRQTAFF
jgi:hypothetical protein